MDSSSDIQINYVQLMLNFFGIYRGFSHVVNINGENLISALSNGDLVEFPPILIIKISITSVNGDLQIGDIMLWSLFLILIYIDTHTHTQNQFITK